MSKNFLKHGFEYILVFLTLGLGLVLLEFFRDPNIRLLIISFLAIFYVVVGVFHHWEKKNLKFTQVMEHAAIGFFIFIILNSLYR